MANKVLLKKSAVAAKVPLVTDLTYGELAINYADGKLYFKDSSDNIKSFASSASDLLTLIKTVDGTGSGLDADLLDGLSSTSFARSGANSDITSLSGVTGAISSPTYIDFTSSTPTLQAGRMWYNSTTGSWNLGMGGGNITQQVGEEFFRYGKASSTISDTNLQLIYKTGVVGGSGVIKFAPTVAGITDADLIVGVATEPIATNGFGRVTTSGLVRGINTTGSAYSETWADGDHIWYNPVTGGLTKTKPTAPNIKLMIGIVINAGTGGSGTFFVKFGSSSELGGTDSNVQLGTQSDGDLLVYSSANSRWENKPQSILTVGNADTVDTYHASISNVASTIAVRDTDKKVSSSGFKASAAMFEGSATISENYSIASGNNAMSPGPITVADGVTISIPDGSVWTVV